MQVWFLLLGLAMGVPMIVSAAPVQAQTSIWKRFTAHKLGFSVVIPGTPQEKKDKNLTVYEVTREQEKVRYAVGVIELSVAPGEDPKLVNDVFEGIRKGAEKQETKLVSFRTIRLAEQYPGREMNFRLPEAFQARWRVYVVGKRAYFLSVTTTQENMESRLARSVEMFLNSLRLQEPKPSQPQVSPTPR